MEFNSLLPLKTTSKKEGREHVEGLWKILGGEDFFTTPYQLAVQMGTYYEDDDLLYPRFDKLLSIKEAAQYMHHWGENYYSPNPYTKSIKDVKPVVINKFLVNYAQTVYDPSFRGALKEMFGDNVIGNTDILKNMLNNFSEVNIEGDIVTIKPNAKGKSYNEDEVYPSIDVNDKKAFFEHFDRIECSKPITFDSKLPLQQIFYGAPGTGKSFTIDKDTNENNRIRTTFHPDYDYAAFVGCYKPTTQKHAIEHKYGIYDVAALQAKFAAFSPDNSSKRITRFSCLYYNSLERMTSSEWQQIFLGFAKPTIEQDVNNGIAAAKEINNAHVLQDSQITYSFVPQSFTKAYVEAWRRFANPECTDKNYYLVIEEINRGNCAQIFGDLFQLLDRTRGGYSSYAVETDTDLQQFLATDETWRLNITLTEDIKNDEGRVIAKAEDVMSGKVLVLPPNLHIWATMNTSDQSLFPIDSAFKRRWDWTYVPIKYENTNWKVVLSDKSWCSWTELQTMLNDLIYEATESEDKMLGDWFVKADEKNEITEEQLVGKIIFYLWNDVAKVDAGTLFDLEVEKRGRNKAVTFSDFYKLDGKTDTTIVKDWLTKIGITINEPESVDPEDEEDLDAELSETEIDNEDDSEIKAKRRELWTKFNEIMQSKGRAEANRVAPIKSYYNIRLGTTGLRIKNTVHVSPMTDFPPSVYTEVHFKEESYHIYEELNSRKNDLEKLFNEQIRWKENPKSHVISVERKTDFDNEDDTKAAIEWLANASIKMYDFIKPLVK